MKNNRSKTTYRERTDKLHALGFERHTVVLNDKRGDMFAHNAIKRAAIVLPEFKPNDIVEPFFINSVLATLKAHNLLANSNNGF